MTWSACSDRRVAAGLPAAAAALLVLAAPIQARAAETSDPVRMGRTLVLLKVDSAEPVPIQAQSTDRPPVIRIQFPARRLTASLPERSTVAQGPIQAIAARYQRAGNTRFLRVVEIRLSGPYASRAWSEPGRIVIEVSHPATIGSASLEVGLRRGTIIGGIGKPAISERFRAMQEALAEAVTIPPPAPAATLSAPIDLVSGKAPIWQSAPPSIAPASAPRRRASWGPGVAIALAGLGLLVAIGWGVGSVMARSRRRVFPAGPRLPSGAVLIDQLVWRAFERQGHQLVLEQELTRPPFGAFRVIIKDGVKQGLLFVWYGPFFEKQTVERFLGVLREAKLPQGILVASGSFTVPAQRMAQQRGVTLIGREQLTELLSVGAGSEYYARQLEQHQAKLDEAKETLRQYAQELDGLRRQRNEASWYLGEERTRAAKLETQLDEATQQLRRYEADLHRWEQETAAVRKRWEESEWYLGESRDRARYLESQITALQELAKRAEAAERERDETHWYLGEERVHSEAMERQLAELQQQVEAATGREQALQQTIAELREEIQALQTQAVQERRGALRLSGSPARFEILGRSDATLFAGSPRDVSESGAGVESPEELPATAALAIRITFSGRRPIRSNVKPVWQREDAAGRYHSGWRFLDLSDASRKRLRALLAASQASVR